MQHFEAMCCLSFRREDVRKYYQSMSRPHSLVIFVTRTTKGFPIHGKINWDQTEVPRGTDI